MEKELRINLTSIFDSKGIDNAKRSFSELERESLRAASSQRSVSSASLDAAKSVDNLSERVGFMGHAYVGFQAVMAGSSYMSDLTKDAIRQADTWNLLEGRLRLVTDSTQQLVSVQADLFDIAQESRTGYEQNSYLYARIARATQDMNKSQYETLDVTEAISKSFIVSGDASESAKAAVIQLGQGFASGTLRGEELNSVLEQAPRLAEAIADGMGVSIGKLKDMGAEGKLTASKVYEAIRTQKNAIEEEFDQMPKTVGQSLVVLTNQIGLTIHEFDQMHGVTTGIAEAISGVTVVLSEHSGEIGDYVGYVGGAVSAILVWKAGTIALNGIQAAHAAYVVASTIATTSYSIATNTTTTAVTTLTARQVAANVAVGAWNKLIAINPYAIAGAAIIGVGLVLKDQADQLRDSVRRTAVDVENLSAKALQAKITYGTMQLDTVNRSIEDPSFMKSAFGNERIDLHRKVQLERELKAYGVQLQKLHEDASKPSSGKSGGGTSNLPTEKELKASAKAADEYAKNYKSLQDAIFGISASDHDKAIKAIEDQAKVWRDQKMPEIEIAKYVSNSKLAIDRKELKELGDAMKSSLSEKEKQWTESEAKDTEKTLKRWEDGKAALTEYYTAMGNDAELFAITESDRMQKLAEAGILSNEQMLAVWVKDNEKFQKDQRDKDNKFWLDLFDDFEKAMGDQIFNAAVKDKWQSLGDWLKDFWGSVTTSIARAASSQLSQGIIGSVKDIVGLGDSGSASSNIVGTFKTLLAGGALSGSAMYGATTDSEGFTTTAGGTVFDAAGQITKAGTDGLGEVGSIVNGISTIRTAYEAMTGALSESIATNFGVMGSYAGQFTGSAALADGIGSFGMGLSSPFAGFGAGGAAGWGSLLGGTALGAGAGYAIGSLGDMLFGADTKASSYGAIGGGLGAAVGSIVPGIGTLIGGAIGSALGSVIGGLFGSTKEVDRGLYFRNDTTSLNGSNTIQSYRDTESKSWFGGSGNSDYNDITDSQKKSIEGIFKTYDYLLNQLGSTKNIVLKASRYTAETFQDEIAQGFIATYTGIEQHVSEYLYSRNGVVFKKYNDTEEMTKIYNMWSDYAKSVDKTVMQAMTDSVNTFISSKRTFEIWALDRSGQNTESLRKQAEWAQADFQNLSNTIGASGVTIENFLTMYEDAVKSSFDPTTITQWNQLGTALQAATNAQDSYTKSLQDTAVNGFNQLSSAYSTFSKGITETQGYIDQLNGSVMTFAQAGDDPAKIMQAYQAQADAITQISSNRLSALQKELDYSKSLYKAANNLRYTAMSGTAKFDYTNSMLDRYIADAITKMSSGKDISAEVSSITDLAGNYADLAQGYFTTQADFDYAVGTMANKIEALGGKGSVSTLSDIETAINMENDSLSSELKALKDEASGRLQSVIDAYSTGQQLIADQMQSQLDNYAEFWGVDSPIVAKLQEILQSLGLQYSLNTSGAGPSSESAITDAYQNILGRTPDTAGSDYWTSKINSGDLNTGEAGIAIGAAAATNGEISVSQYISDLYTNGLGRTPDASGLAYWDNVVSSGQLSIDQLASTFSSSAATNGETFHAFADGGMVKGGRGGVVGLVGEKNYDELITPLKDSNDPLGGKAIIAELKALREEVAKLREENTKYSSQTADNTKPSRYV